MIYKWLIFNSHASLPVCTWYFWLMLTYANSQMIWRSLNIIGLILFVKPEISRNRANLNIPQRLHVDICRPSCLASDIIRLWWQLSCDCAGRSRKKFVIDCLREVRCLWYTVILGVSPKFTFQLETCLVYLGLILTYWLPHNAMNQKNWWPLVWRCYEMFMVKAKWNSHAISCNAAPTQVLDGSWWYVSKKETRTGNQNMNFRIICGWFGKTSKNSQVAPPWASPLILILSISLSD